MSNFFLPLDQVKLLHRLWSVRLAFVGAVLEGAYFVIPAFQEYVTPFQLLGISIALSVSIIFARAVNQTGLDF